MPTVFCENTACKHNLSGINDVSICNADEIYLTESHPQNNEMFVCLICITEEDNDT